MIVPAAFLTSLSRPPATGRRADPAEKPRRTAAQG